MHFQKDSLFAFVRYCPSLSAGPAIDLLSALMNNGVACFFLINIFAMSRQSVCERSFSSSAAISCCAPDLPGESQEF